MTLFRAASQPAIPITEGEGLIKGLIERGDREKNHRAKLHLLAVACLEATVLLSDETRLAVQKRLDKLAPPKDFAQALDLAAAGEMAVPYLARKSRYSPEIEAACVRALTHIGG